MMECLEQEVSELMKMDNVSWFKSIDELLKAELYYEEEPKNKEKYSSLTWEKLVRLVLSLKPRSKINYEKLKDFFTIIEKESLLDYFQIKQDYLFKKS